MTLVEDSPAPATADRDVTGAGQSDKPRRRRRRWLARLTVAAFTILLITEFVGPFATTWLIESRLRDCVDLGAVHIDTGGGPFVAHLATGTFRDESVELERLRLSQLPTTNVRFTATELSVSRGLFFSQNGEVSVQGGSVTLDVSLADLASAVRGQSAGMLQLSADEGRLKIRDTFGVVGFTVTDAEFLAILATGSTLATRTDIGRLGTRAIAGDMAALLPTELRVTHVAIRPDRVTFGAAVNGTLSITGGAIPC